MSALKDQRHTVRISRAAPQPFLLLPQALPGRAHPSQRRSSTSRHRHVLPARARRRQLHSDVAHADHAPSSHWKIEHKTASLLPYALQTASTNLRQTKFDPRVHEVILDPRDSRNSPLDTSDLWDDEDFEEEEEEELDEVEAGKLDAELAYVTARYTALAPFGKVAALLSELLPIDGAQNAGTVRNRTLRVGGDDVEPVGFNAGPFTFPDPEDD